MLVSCPHTYKTTNTLHAHKRTICMAQCAGGSRPVGTKQSWNYASYIIQSQSNECTEYKISIIDSNDKQKQTEAYPRSEGTTVNKNTHSQPGCIENGYSRDAGTWGGGVGGKERMSCLTRHHVTDSNKRTLILTLGMAVVSVKGSTVQHTQHQRECRLRYRAVRVRQSYESM